MGKYLSLHTQGCSPELRSIEQGGPVVEKYWPFVAFPIFVTLVLGWLAWYGRRSERRAKRQAKIREQITAMMERM
jgi:hypothetical protein